MSLVLTLISPASQKIFNRQEEHLGELVGIHCSSVERNEGVLSKVTGSKTMLGLQYNVSFFTKFLDFSLIKCLRSLTST